MIKIAMALNGVASFALAGVTAAFALMLAGFISWGMGWSEACAWIISISLIVKTAYWFFESRHWSEGTQDNRMNAGMSFGLMLFGAWQLAWHQNLFPELSPKYPVAWLVALLLGYLVISKLCTMALVVMEHANEMTEERLAAAT